MKRRIELRKIIYRIKARQK